VGAVEPAFRVRLANQNSAAGFDFGVGWALPEDTSLEATLDVGADVDVNITAHFDNEI
jgi:hypothetical protein